MEMELPMAESRLMMEPSPESEKPKKRQRMSVVCLNCKARKIKCDKKRPSCTNCIKCNVGHLCEYEPPHWVSRVTTSSGQPIVALKEAEARARQLSAQASTNVLPATGPVIATVGVGGINAVHDEIKRLRAQLQTLEESVGVGFGPAQSLTPLSLSVQDEDNHDVVDFYALYNSLIVKRSGMEEYKPLSSLAHYKKDQYFMIMVGYFNLCGTLYKGRFGDLKRRAGNKKTRLDASLTEFLYLLGERDSPEVVEVVSMFIKERLPKNQIKNNHFPNMGEQKDSDIQQSIKSTVEAYLPPKGILRIYMARFFKYIYPYFPFVDQSFFEERLFNNILISRDEESPITVTIEEKFDFVLLATFLVIIRLTYIALPPASALPGNEKIILNFPISTQCIATSLAALSLFKMMRKTKLTIVQALLYLRVYFNCAPEDGDGAELTQSQILFSSIVQSAYTIGLNRDASRHTQMNFDKDYANLWRRLWLGILEIDKFTSTIAGHIPIIQNLNSYEMRFPELDESSSKMAIAMNDEYKRSQRVLKLYFDLSNMVNNLVNSPKVNALQEVLRQMNVYVNINYSIDEMKKIADASEDEAETVSFVNSKRLMHNFQTKALTLAVYHAICIHYESTTYQNLTKLKEYQSLLLNVTIELSNLLYRFLVKGFNEYVDESHTFIISRYSENMLQRVINSLISLTTRLYHTLDLLYRGIGSQSILESVKETVELTFRTASGMNVLMQNTLGTKYYQAFKTSLKFKFMLRSLRKDGYKCIRETMQFLNQKFPDDPVARLSLLQRLDLKISPQTVLQELDNMNSFVNCSVSDIQQWKGTVLNAIILNDQVLSSDSLIWEPSFKTLPVSEPRGSVSGVVDQSDVLAGVSVGDISPIGGSPVVLDDILSINNPAFGDYDDLLLKEHGVQNNDWLFRL